MRGKGWLLSISRTVKGGRPCNSIWAVLPPLLPFLSYQPMDSLSQVPSGDLLLFPNSDHRKCPLQILASCSSVFTSKKSRQHYLYNGHIERKSSVWSTVFIFISVKLHDLWFISFYINVHKWTDNRKYTYKNKPFTSPVFKWFGSHV